MTHGLNKLAAPLLQEAGINMPAGPLANNDFVDLYRLAADLLNERAAISDGKTALTARDYNLMCRCLLSCVTLEEAIHCAEDFNAMLYPRLGVMSLQIEGSSAKLLIDSQRKNPNRCSCLVDVIGLLGLVQLFSWLTGEKLHLRSVTLGYSNREDAEPLLGLFGVPVHVGAEVYCLEFYSQQLARPIIRRPEELADYTSTFPYDIVGSQVHTLPLRVRVRVYLDAALAKGEPMPDLKALAALIGGSERTLRKRLGEEGTSFSELRDSSRRQTAERYLAHTSWTVDQIVGHLGFSDSLAFRRAFRRWTGLTPTQYRRQVV